MRNHMCDVIINEHGRSAITKGHIPMYTHAISTCLRDNCRSLPRVCLVLTVDARKEIRWRLLVFSN